MSDECGHPTKRGTPCRRKVIWPANVCATHWPAALELHVLPGKGKVFIPDESEARGLKRSEPLLWEGDYA